MISQNKKFILVLIVFSLLPIFSTQIFSQETTEKLILEAKNKESDGNYKDALVLFEKILDLEPENVEALNGKGATYLKLGNITESEFYFNKSLEIDPNYIPAQTNLGIVQAIQNNFEDALGIFNMVLEIDEDNVEALLNKSILLISNYKEINEGVELLNRVLEIDPDNKEALYNKKVVYKKMTYHPFDGIVQKHIHKRLIH